MKKLFMATLLLIMLAACSDQTVEKNTEVSKPEQNTEVKKDIKKEEEISKEQNEDDNEPQHKFITEEEFNKKFKKDPEEKQYKDGKFELKDGSIIKADDYSYGESDIFDYASAIFKNGSLVHLQIETEKSQEEIEKGLGIKFNDGNIVIENRIGYEINFDETFLDENISVFPNEWE